MLNITTSSHIAKRPWCLAMSSREIAELTGKRHNNVVRDIERMLRGLGEGLLKFEQTYRDPQNNQTYRYFSLPKDLTLTLVSGYNVRLRKKIIDRWIELEQVARASASTIPKSLPEALRLAADQAEEIATLEPKALAFDSLINNGELPSLRTFFKQFHELNLTAIPATLGELGYLRRSDRYAGQWEVRRSHPRAAALFRQRINQGLKWNYVTVLLTPQGQEEMARLYRQGAFPKLARFSH